LIAYGEPLRNKGPMADKPDLAEESPMPPQQAGAGEQDSAATARRWRKPALLAGGVLLAVVAGVWLAREQIARGIIDRQVSALALPVRYTIVSIGPGTQVLRDVVIGDPAHPDLTIERAELSVDYSRGMPRAGRINLVRPRLFGTYLGGKLSFGSLDRVLFAPAANNQPPRLPDYNITLTDGRALVESDYGRLGIKLDGNGPLRGGFAGTLAVVAPALTVGPCEAGRTTAFGKLSVDQEQPRFAGPVRMAALRCAGGITAAPAAMTLDATLDKQLRDVRASGDLRSGAIAAPQGRVASLSLRFGGSLTGGALSGRVTASAADLRMPAAAAWQLAFDGLVRARASSAALDVRGTVDARALRRGPALEQALASAQASAAGTLLAPMIAQTRAALAREESGSRLIADVVYGQDAAGSWHAGAPSAVLRGGSGQGLLNLSRVSLAGGGPGVPRFTGNFITGGEGLPQISGRVEQNAAQGTLLNLTMPAYRAGGGSLAVPAMKIVQNADGAIGFSGVVGASGAIPGGRADNLVLPLQGSISAGGTLALFPRCITPRFDRLTLGAAVLDARAITLCPAGGGAIVRRGPRGIEFAATAPALALSGRLGSTPLSVNSGPVSLRWPGALTASAVTAVLGPKDAQNRFTLAAVSARLGKAIAGTFAGAEGRLAAVPLDLTRAAGAWSYAGGALSVSGARFDLADRTVPARFEPLTAQGAGLTFQNNRISANALLRTAKAGHEVVRAAIQHDLASARGSADLVFDGLVFDEGKGGLQPADLTLLAKGIVANVNGKVTGSGRIDWDAKSLTSTGDLTTRQLDLAAAFGPVKGLAGTLRFVDLLGMVTAPHQVLKVASVNPGIEVTDGVVDLELRPDQVIRLNSAKWPFLGGSIALEPSDLRMALAEERRLTLTIVGFDAARFLDRMQLGNIAATGTFDGQLPLAFDDKGGHILGGNLVSRPPGGNVSYIGALSYKDLSPMANFAFDALKSMDYKVMTIGMRGNLAGDLVTDLRFRGVRQGKGTKQNFLTRRVANLPLQFNISIRAPFYQLINSLKGTYDPAFIRDPRTLGLVDANGRAVQRAAAPALSAKPVLTPAGLTISFPEAAKRIQPPAIEHEP
jgi:hypothetical protein